MKDSKKIRTLWISIIGLIIINLSVLIWMWFSPHGLPGQMSPERIENTLNFDRKQKERFEIMKDKHFAEVNPIRDSIKKIKSELIDYIKRDTPDKKIIEEKLNLLANKIIENEDKTLKHFTEVRAICNERQKAIFDNGFLERFKKKEPPHPRDRDKKL
jgi:hypothetical protein